MRAHGQKASMVLPDRGSEPFRVKYAPRDESSLQNRGFYKGQTAVPINETFFKVVGCVDRQFASARSRDGLAGRVSGSRSCLPMWIELASIPQDDLSAGTAIAIGGSPCFARALEGLL